jgi:hypothetical protein
MTMGDHYTKARAGDYYNKLLTGSEDDFKRLLRKYSLRPDDNAGSVGKQVGEAGTGLAAQANQQFLAGSTSNNVELREMGKDHLVAWVNLSLQGRSSSALQTGDRVKVTAGFHNPGNHVQAYFLPWLAGSSIRMTIPQMGFTKPGDPDPNVFFTAAISGCSIFFQGTRQRPTIYHCGGETNYKKAQINEAIGFWEEVVAAHIDHDRNKVTGQAAHGALNAQRVNKSHYVATPGCKARPDQVQGTLVKQHFTTPAALAYQRQLETRTALTSVTIEDVSPWGCVLGRRAANGDWTFYLQENATIMYHKVSRSLSHPGKTTKHTNTVDRPLRWRQIFPSGATHHCVQSTIPKVIK